MKMAPHERFALGVVGLLVAVGGVVQLRARPSAADWLAGGDSLAAPSAAHHLAAVEEEVERSRRRAQPLRPGERIDPNRASADELRRLPRVGPALAERIVAHREEHGPFHSLADVDAVSGIGPALLSGIAPHLELPAAAGAAGAAGGTATSAAHAQGPPAAAGRAGSAGSTLPVPLDVNRATAAELQRLPGVGPVLAQRIVEWRDTHGPFRTTAELERVPGIGPKMRERLAPLVRVGP
jgi:competence protein ComEA